MMIRAAPNWPRELGDLFQHEIDVRVVELLDRLAVDLAGDFL